MITKKNILAILAVVIFSISCSKDKEETQNPTPTPVVVDTRLALPATLENVTLLPIPDATANTSSCGSGTNVGMAENSIVIDKDGIIVDATKLSIELDLSHTHCSDLVVQLITPSGDSCGLIKRISATTDLSCGSRHDFVTGNKLTFNANFTNSVVANPIVTGNYTILAGSSTFPTNVPIVPLSTFLLGKNIKGTWKIKVYDYGTGDLGKLNAWKLKFDVGALQ